METKILIFSAVFVGLISIIGWLYYAAGSQPVPPPTLKVSATIYPLYDLVRQVAGPNAQVILILPPGSSPHTYEADPKNIQDLAGSQAVFSIGHGLDSWVESLAQNAGVANIITVDRGISLMPSQEEDEGGLDPHYYLSYQNAIVITQTIADTLSEFDPANAVAFRQNANNLNLQLSAAFAANAGRVNSSGIKSIATFHNAFAYFVKDFGLDVAAVFEPFPGQQPSPEYVKNFQESIVRHQIKVIYTEPQLPVSAIMPIANDLGVKVGQLDPLGGTIDKDTIQSLFQYNFDHILEGGE